MTTGAGRRGRVRSFGTIGWRLFPLALILPVLLLFSMVWQSIGEQAAFAELERDGVRYIQALGPLEIALTNAGSAAVSNSTASRKPLADAVEAVALVDNELGERLRTRDRWAGLRIKIESLPSAGAAASVIAAYGGASDLLLALIEKVRNDSKLIRDPEADSYYLQDGAAQELPEGIVAAARYTDLLVGAAELSTADRAQAVVDVNSAQSDLVSNARDLSDDVRLAVEGTGSRSLGSALLNKLDRFNRSIDNLVPLMSPVLAGTGGIDVARVIKARAEMQSAAADLSAALLAQIDIALRDRLSSLGHRRLLAIGTLVVSVLLALAPIGAALAGRRNRRPATGEQDRPQPPPPNPWPVEPVPVPVAASGPEAARWEHFGAPR